MGVRFFLSYVYLNFYFVTNCRKLYVKHFAGDKSEFGVTLDKALIY